MSLQNYIQDLNNVHIQYNLYWVIPYGNAYAEAYNNFQKVVGDQKKIDSVIADATVLIASLGIGAGISVYFGSSALKNIPISEASRHIANRNLEFKKLTLGLFNASVASSYLFGNAWERISTLSSNTAKQQINSVLSISPFGGLTPTPLVFQNALRTYLDRVAHTKHTVAAILRDDKTIGNSDKAWFSENFRMSDYFSNAPTSSTIPDFKKAVRDIELIFYMSMIMASDYLYEIDFDNQSFGKHVHHGSHRTLGPITQTTSSPDYPTRLGNAGTIRGVNYKRPGGYVFSAIMKRTNELFKDAFGTNFEQGSYGLDELKRAENLTTYLLAKHFSATWGHKVWKTQ